MNVEGLAELAMEKPAQTAAEDGKPRFQPFLRMPAEQGREGATWWWWGGGMGMEDEEERSGGGRGSGSDCICAACAATPCTVSWPVSPPSQRAPALSQRTGG